MRRLGTSLAVGCLVVLFAIGETSPQATPQVTLLSIQAKRLLEGDGQNRRITVEAVADKGAQVNFVVRYWPQNAPVDAGEEFIHGFSVTADDKGVVKTVLPKPFEKIGIYRIMAQGAGNVLKLVHQPKGLLAKVFAVPDILAERLNEIAGDVTRGISTGPLDRVSDRADMVAVWTAKMPDPGQQIAEKDLRLSIKAAMMPNWSPDGNAIACIAWREKDKRWELRAYTVQLDRGTTSQLWNWDSPERRHDLSPVWAPSGKAIAFVRLATDKTSDVWMLQLDSAGHPTKENKLTKLGSVQQIVGWNGNGAILFEAGTSDKALETELLEVRLIGAAEGQVPRLVALDLPYGTLLGVAPARDSVIYTDEFLDEDPPFSEILEVTKNGPKAVLAGEPRLDRWPSVTRDGKWLAFDSNRQVTP